MDFGATIFFTDYSIGPVALGRALGERGFESLWAPEHYREAGVARLVFNLPPSKAEEVLPILDRCASLIR